MTLENEITEIVNETRLSKLQNEMISFLEQRPLIQQLLTDTLKGEKPIIGTVPLNFNSFSRPYNLAVFHTLKEKIIQKNGVWLIESPIYVDVSKKTNSKDTKSIFNDLDKWAWTIISMIFQSPRDFNNSCMDLEYVGKNIYEPDVEKKDLKDVTFNYICEIQFKATFNVTYFW